MNQAATIAQKPVSTPTDRFIWPIASTTICESPMTIGTARNRKNAASVPPESMLPLVAMVSATKPAIATQASVNSGERSVRWTRAAGAAERPGRRCRGSRSCLRTPRRSASTCRTRSSDSATSSTSPM